MLILALILVNATINKNGLIYQAKLSKRRYEYSNAKQTLNIKLLQVRSNCKNLKIEYSLTNVATFFSKDTELQIMGYYVEGDLQDSTENIPVGLDGIAVKVLDSPKYTFLIEMKNGVPVLTKVTILQTIPDSVDSEDWIHIAIFEESDLGLSEEDNLIPSPTATPTPSIVIKIGNDPLLPEGDDEEFSDDYGKDTDYKSTEDTTSDLYNIVWQLFYDDRDYIYLIASDYVLNSLLPANGNTGFGTGDLYKTSGANGNYNTAFCSNGKYNNYVLSSSNTNYYNYLNSATNENAILNKSTEKSYGVTTKYLRWKALNPNSTNANIRATAFMMDTSKWSQFAGNTEGAFAIGGPTVEMFVKSYNTGHSTKLGSYDDNSNPSQLVSESYNTNGYHSKWENSQSWTDATLTELDISQSTLNGNTDTGEIYG